MIGLKVALWPNSIPIRHTDHTYRTSERLRLCIDGEYNCGYIISLWRITWGFGIQRARLFKSGHQATMATSPLCPMQVQRLTNCWSTLNLRSQLPKETAAIVLKRSSPLHEFIGIESLNKHTNDLEAPPAVQPSSPKMPTTLLPEASMRLIGLRLVLKRCRS